MSTCLFTGDALSAETKEEHTIPRGLGGRVRSRIVSSTEFNERSGAYLDETLKSPYAPMLNILAPLLSAEHQPGLLQVDVPGEEPGLALDRGVLTRTNLVITERDSETRRPREAAASELAPLRRLASQLGRADRLSIRSAPASESRTVYRSAPVILADLEIAALKCALLAFDHLLSSQPNRFTRHSCLAGARELVRGAVVDRQIDDGACQRISLGMQYDRIPLYLRLRESIPLEKTPFEHYLLVAGNGPCRCIDLVWGILGFDPFGFRLCRDWVDGDFAFGFANGVLKGATHSECVSLPPPDELLCRPSNLRAFPEVTLSAQEKQQVVETVSGHRMRAYQEAVVYVEMNADDAVRAKIVEACKGALGNEQEVGVQVHRTLQRLYGRTALTEFFSEQLSAVFEGHSSQLQDSARSQAIRLEADSSLVDWDSWLRVYRDCIQGLVELFGLPGDVFADRTTIGDDNTAARLVGEAPAEQSVEGG